MLLIKSWIKKYWRSLLACLSSLIIWILVKENIFHLSYPAWGYLVFGAMEYDGDGDFTTISKDSSTDLGTGDFTIGFQVKLIVNKGSGTGLALRNNFIGNSNWPTNGWQVNYERTQNKVIFYIFNVGRLASPGGELDDLGWHYIVVWRSGNLHKLYIDDVELDSSVAGGQNLTSPNDILIGINANFTDATRDLNGIVDEVVISDTALSRSELTNLNSRVKYMPRQIQAANLKMYLPMNDGVVGISANGDTVKDVSLDPTTKAFNGNDGVNTNGTWASGILTYPRGISYVIPEELIEAVRLAAMTKRLGNKLINHYGIGTN